MNNFENSLKVLEPLEKSFEKLRKKIFLVEKIFGRQTLAEKIFVRQPF